MEITDSDAIRMLKEMMIITGDDIILMGGPDMYYVAVPSKDEPYSTRCDSTISRGNSFNTVVREAYLKLKE